MTRLVGIGLRPNARCRDEAGRKGVMTAGMRTMPPMASDVGKLIDGGNRRRLVQR